MKKPDVCLKFVIHSSISKKIESVPVTMVRLDKIYQFPGFYFLISKLIQAYYKSDVENVCQNQNKTLKKIDAYLSGWSLDNGFDSYIRYCRKLPE